MSLTASLNNALSGLKAANIGIAVTSDNIANAMTEGFQKREVTRGSQLGGGVSVTAIGRHVDAALLGQMHQLNASTSFNETQKQALQTLYNAMGLHSENGDLHQHLADLKSLLIDAPQGVGSGQRLSDIAAKGRQFANMVSHVQSVLSSQSQSSVAAIGDQVAKANNYISQISRLNKEIAQSSDTEKNQLSDRRDVALNNLSQIMPITIRFGDQNDVKIYTEQGMPLLDRGPKPLEFDGQNIYQKTANGRVPLIMTSKYGNGALGSGSLAAHIHMVNVEIPELARGMDELVNMAVDLPDMFNATSNNLAVEFGLFVQSGSGLAVNPTLLTGAPLSNGTAIDGGSISLKPPTAIGQIIPPFSHLENKSLDVISSVASRLKSSETQIESQTLQKQAIQGVFSKSGVQLEDEAFNLVTLQNAFEANARVLKIVDELHKALVRM